MLNVQENATHVPVQKLKPEYFLCEKRLLAMFFVCLIAAFVLGASDRASAQDPNYAKTMQRIYGNMFLLNAGGQFGLSQGGASLGSGTTDLPSGFRGQSPEPDDEDELQNQWEIWGGAAYTHMNASGYEEQKRTYQGYRVNRAGFVGGLKRAFSETSSGGILLAFASPEFHQVGAVGSYIYDDNKWATVGSQVDVDVKDFQIAIHYDKKFWNDDWEVSLFLGGGVQWMHWHRTMNDIGTFHYHGNTTGNTLTGAVYLVRVVGLTKKITMRGLVGLESEHSWVYGFKEDGHTIAPGYLSDSELSGAFQAYQSKDVSYSRNTVRAGLRYNHESWMWRMGSSFQIFYGYAMGADAATVSISSVDVNEAAGGIIEIGSIKGYAVGRHSLTLGGNLHVFFDEDETFELRMDYNAVLYQHLTTQNVAVTLAKRY